MNSAIKEIVLIAQREFVAFVKSGIGGLLIYVLIIPTWGFMMHANTASGLLWLVFFSVIVCGSVSAGVFANERLSGALEILLTSGAHRFSILAGKFVFVFVLSTLFGLISSAIPFYFGDIVGLHDYAIRISIYAAACLMNTAFDAWLSFRIGNARLVSVFNLGALFAFVIGGKILQYYFEWTALLAIPVMIIVAVIFFAAAYFELGKERVLRPPVS